MSTARRISLRFPDWPAADQAAWQRAIKPGGLFDDQGRAAHWASSTRRTVQYDYGIWLKWCTDQAIPLTTPIGERVAPEQIRAYIADLEMRVAPMTLHGYLARLHQALSVMCPTTDWQWLKRLVNRLEKLTAPGTNKVTRLRDSGTLLALGQSLMGSAPTPAVELSRKARLHAAILYRDGLILALLATRPLRRTNFAGIRLNEHLHKVDQTWWLRFKAGETKQGRLIEQPVPSRLQGPLDT